MDWTILVWDGPCRNSSEGGDSVRGRPQSAGTARADLAFLAMTWQRFGGAQEAQEGLDRLREDLEDPARARWRGPGLLARGPSGLCRLTPLAGEPRC